MKIVFFIKNDKIICLIFVYEWIVEFNVFFLVN